MQYGDQTSFRQSLVIQIRVIGALLMREIITRYGRNNIGFLWLFVEPLMLTLIVSMVWSFLRVDKFSTLNIIAFIITGYPIAMMWRNASRRTIGAISGNISLLYHRNVRVLDTIFARILLEISGATVAQIIISALFVLTGLIDFPHDIFYMLLAWLLMSLFATGLGLIICSIAFYFEPFGKIWGTMSFMMLPLSGAFFFVNSLPPQVREYLIWVPMINGTEMFRHGYFGDSVITYENVNFLILSDIVLLFVGLILVRNFSKGIEPR
ncbi:ABC transporter permease [Otariodibacter oris]|uniref:Transport permease protein n=1 Tax=Otariodibacter oris TaxID=1032623 RepID=A0A420XGI3_9PAST|nr:ABC transporter permease [Otariodibacter oris]QGM80105.1 sugar ABC transporter permease [Otariodibacter oris]RKR71932.1 capsular polysaccharide transport system permease protein [Otariodibacter oris]